MLFANLNNPHARGIPMGPFKRSFARQRYRSRVLLTGNVCSAAIGNLVAATKTVGIRHNRHVDAQAVTVA